MIPRSKLIPSALTQIARPNGSFVDVFKLVTRRSNFSRVEMRGLRRGSGDGSDRVIRPIARPGN